MPSSGESQRRTAGLAIALALLATLPFVGGLAADGTLYYRDLARTFFPVRLHLLEGLAAGELRYWNPYLHEGEPSSLLPLAYPLELLQLLAPSNRGLSLVLVLHVSLAAAAFILLARSLGHSALGAATGALVYAWGGFLLSTLNLYFYIHTAAWAPLLVWACCRAAEARGWGRLAPTLAVATALTTQGIELLLQALLLGVLLARPLDRRRALRLASGLALGLGLSGYVLLPTLGLIGAPSVRAEGFPVAEALAFSLHPFSLLQTLVANLHSDLGDLANQFWGRRYLPGQAYIASLYLGPVALTLAVLGLRQARGRLLGRLCALGAIVSLGQYAGLQFVLALLPHPIVRFPVKAFFLAHFCVALLAAAGIERLACQVRPWRAAGATWLAFTLVLGVGGYALRHYEPVRKAVVGIVLAPLAAPWLRADIAERMGRDAEQAGILCLAAAVLACAAAIGRARLPLAALVVAALGAADLLRAGAGVNPVVPSQDLAPTQETLRLAEHLRQAQARLLVCDTDWTEYLHKYPTPTYQWRQRVWVETLIPAINLQQHVRTVLGFNPTRSVPANATLSGEEPLCRDLDALRGRLREAAVTHVLATRTLDAHGLHLDWTGSPQRIAPLQVFVYAVDEPASFADLGGAGTVSLERATAGHMLARATAGADGEFVVRERWAPGWQASLDGVAAALVPGRRHLTVAVPAGAHSVGLDYVAPGLHAGVGLSLASLAVLALLIAWERERSVGPETLRAASAVPPDNP